MSTPDAAREQEAALAFVRGLLHHTSPDAARTHVDPPTFAALSDGKALYLLLHRSAPHAFREVDEMTADLGDRGRTNRPLRKEHLRTLVNDMNAFANSPEMRKKKKASASDLFLLDVDINVVAGSDTLMGLEEALCDEDEAEVTEAFGELLKLVQSAIALVVLSGGLAVEVARTWTFVSRAHSHVMRAAVDAFAVRHGFVQPNDEQHEAPATHTDPTTTAAADFMSLDNPTSALQAPTAAASATTASYKSDTDALSSALTGLGGDDSYFRNATVQLRRELEEVKARLSDAEIALRQTKDSEASWERRYRMLLEEQSESSAPAAGKSPAASQTANASGPDASDWKQRLASKEEAIQSLVKRVEEQATMLKAFKEATAAQEQGLLAMRRKLKSTEEGLMAKAAERREALERLAIAEDKLAIQLKAKHELENEVEQLRSQVTILQLTQQQHGNEGGDETKFMNSSFASNGSMDRVMQLENELDEARAQREALQKQLFILQKQVTTHATPMADVGAAANDTLKAQIRHLEKEKEQIQQQLAVALGRVEELQNGSTTDIVAIDTSPAAGNRTKGRSTDGSPATTSPVFQAAAAAVGRSPDNSFMLVSQGAEEEESTGAGAAVVDPQDLPNRLRKLRDTTRREHALLSSLLLQYGYKNLMLQQHQVLLHEDHKAAEETATASATPLPEGGAKAAVDGGVFSGSYLARQRRAVEHGLLESIIHGGSAHNVHKRREGSSAAAAATASTSA